MERTGLHRPRVSRETRLLLITAFTALIALWMLARIRFPDRPVPTPVEPLFTQLGARTRFEDFASDISQLRPRIEPLLAGQALRVRNDAAIALTLPQGAAGAPAGEVLGIDPASGLTLVQVPPLPVPPPVAWNPTDLQTPRYLVAADVSAGDLSLQPVFVGSLVPVSTPLWDAPVWRLPQATGLRPGMLVFTTDGLLAGLVFDLGGHPALIPGTLLLAEAARLPRPPAAGEADIGISVQALTPPLQAATGSQAGVIVSWVNPKSHAASVLEVGDVIEAVDKVPVDSPLTWQIQAARARVGRAMALTIRRQGDAVGITLVPGTAPPTDVSALGLTMRAVAGTGALVTEVSPGSAADRAGLRAGDIITLAGDVATPSPAAVRQAFSRPDSSSATLIAYTRESMHYVTALTK